MFITLNIYFIYLYNDKVLITYIHAIIHLIFLVVLIFKAFDSKCVKKYTNTIL